MISENRTETLQNLDVLDTDMQQELSGLIELASTICETPISLINLLDTTSQITKASKGWDIQHIPKEKSFCRYTVCDRDLMIVEDALEDERFQNSEFVQGDPNIRFYAGAPLTTSEGINIGAICTIDTKPKQLSESQKESLRLIANEVMARFILHKKRKTLIPKIKIWKMPAYSCKPPLMYKLLLIPKANALPRLIRKQQHCWGSIRKIC